MYECRTVGQLTQYGRPGNHELYNQQQIYFKEKFDLKHTIMQCSYETFGFLQHRL